MRAPLFLVRPDGVDIFSSLKALCGYVEPIDVLAGEYLEVYDAEATQLRIAVVPGPPWRSRWRRGLPRQMIELEVVGPSDPAAFRAVLARFVPAVRELPADCSTMQVAVTATEALGMVG